jgi:hypothetical protein
MSRLSSNKGTLPFYSKLSLNYPMPRQARAVFAGVPHHITQRGNRREDVFYTDEDREVYLVWLKEYCKQHKVEILAYCLMTNHIHIIAVPKTEAGLQSIFKPLHMRYGGNKGTLPFYSKLSKYYPMPRQARAVFA